MLAEWAPPPFPKNLPVKDPADGVQQPLAATVQDFRMIILEQCGHTPWCERHAMERFYQILEHELSAAH